MNLRNLAIWGAILVAAVVIYSVMQGQTRGGASPTDIAYSDMLAKIDSGDIAKADVGDPAIVVTDKGGHEFRAFGPKDNLVLQQRLADHKDIKTSFPPNSPNLLLSFLFQMAPLLLLFGLTLLFMRQMQGGARGAMGFGKSKARLLTENKNRVTFDDVAGVDEAKEDLTEIVDFLKDPAKFQRLGGKIPKGALMVGPPGTGKTLLGRAVAGEAGVPFFFISGSDFVEMFVGVGASRVRDLFEQGKKHAPCIIFIDEIDAVGRHRGAGLGGGHDEREQTLNQLLVEMDGFESNEGVIIIAATNRPDVLDPAILRPGRFDRRITVPRPDVRGREEILRVHAKRTPLSPDVDLEILARGTPGFSGADLENLVNEAALLAARQDKDALNMVDFELAKDKVYMGTERRSMVISDEEKRTTAVHEAGHTLISVLIEHHDPVHKVSIIPRGPALGVTWYLPKDDRHNLAKDQAESSIAVALGGRIAEEIIFGRMTTGAGNDIEKATEIARKMVCEWGMSEKLGPLAYGKKEESIFLGRDYGQRQQDYSEQTAQEIDQEVRAIVQRQYVRVKDFLSRDRDKLQMLADSLIERETLDSEEIAAVLEGRELPKRERLVIPTYAEKDKQSKEKRRVASIFGGPPKPATSGS
ncbi:MAG TPA: ATP-dependent zinc metalloprotease FtsH [Caulobacteraceae bacterium]|nr:ATP-dependent zinc metalloprotease FtsH [Caulobacteraceae bacterium]